MNIAFLDASTIKPDDVDLARLSLLGGLVLLLNLSTSIHLLAHKSDEWPESPIFTRLHHPITELAGKLRNRVN